MSQETGGGQSAPLSGVDVYRENLRANAIFRLRKAADELEEAQFNLREAGDDDNLVGCLRRRCLVLAGEKVI